MKKLTMLVYGFCVVACLIILTACGGGGGGTTGGTAGGGGVTTPPTTGHKVMLMSAAPAPASNGQFTYSFGLPIALIQGSRAHPFYQVSTDAFTAINRFTGISADGNYLLVDITTYDMNLSFIYGGDDTTTPKSYASIDLMGGGYFDSTSSGGVVTIGFNQGAIYDKATVPVPVNPPPVVPDPITIVSKGQDPVTKMYRYKVTANLSAVNGSTADPFIVGDFTNWGRVRMPNVGGFANYSGIYSYNKEVKFSYGGDSTANTWASIDKSRFYSAADNSLVAGLSDGTAVIKNVMTPRVFGDTYADSGNIVGFTLDATGTQLTIYFNLSTVSGLINQPFWSSTFTGWQRQPITITDASGWASTTITIAQPTQLAFNFGGDSTALTYADTHLSAVFVPMLGTLRDILAVDVMNNTVTKAVALTPQ